ncbi:MAG: beta-N-acetylhexosaminidase, partial [Gammaproteobacteria bacterium]
MSLGPLMVDLVGTELSPTEREMLMHPLVGGVILFTRNFADPDQVDDLVRDIHALRDPHLIVAVDQEGGRVQRFRKGFTRLPPVNTLGRLFDRDPDHALDMAEVTGWLMASELRAVGVDISFAPVVDLARGVSGVIGDRAFHHSPAVIDRIAQSYVRGMRMGGMAATLKHFPGHGSVPEDSHLVLPHDSRRLADMRLSDMLPFERMIHREVEAVMMAHVVYPDVDDQPASFSRVWIHDILRGELGFQGAVFSDDLSMGGAEVMGGPADRARAALEAGCDMLPICNHPEAAMAVIDDLRQYDNPASHMRLIRMHGRGNVNPGRLFGSREWRAAVKANAASAPCSLRAPSGP